MLHYQFASAWLQAHTPNTQRGAGLVEFLIIAAGVALVALAVVVIYTQVVTDKANSIDLG